MWSVDFQDLALPELLNHVIGHAVGGINGFLVRIPQAVGNELQDERGIDGPQKRSCGRSTAPGFEVGEFRGDGRAACWCPSWYQQDASG